MAERAGQFEVPAGRYWLGDPCYTVPDEMWMPWLEAAWAANGHTHDVMVAQIPGTEHVVRAFGTQFGDGAFRGSDGNIYGVDAGLIGLVPEALNPAGDTMLATLVTFELNTQGKRTEDGLLIFGDIAIMTGDEHDSDDGEDDQ